MFEIIQIIFRIFEKKDYYVQDSKRSKGVIKLKFLKIVKDRLEVLCLDTGRQVSGKTFKRF